MQELIIVPLYTVAVLVLGASITAGLFVFHVAVVPLIFKYSSTFRRNLIFANFVQWPLNIDYEDPSASGVEGGRNFTIEHQSKVDNCLIKIGVWHIVPKSVYERHKGRFEDVSDRDQLSALLDEELVNSKAPIMMYCHGNANSRAASHRILLYKLFQCMGYHTIALDYRGYGDSSPVRPSEAGVVEDALVVYHWITATTKGKTPIFVWGHSLGTGISSHMLGNLDVLSKDILDKPEPLPLPNGLILEAPFNNMAEEVAYHPLAKLVSWLPYFRTTFVAPFVHNPVHSFKSDTHLARVQDLPVLILHARDDVIVPYVVGDKLYKSVLESRSGGGATVALHSFDRQENLGHKGICTAKDIERVIGEFVTSHQ